MNIQVVQVASVVIGSIISLGVLIAGAGYGVGKFLEGKNKASQDTVKTFTTQILGLNQVCDQQAKQIATLQQHDKDHTQEIGRLQGINEEKDKKITELTELLQNRSPDLENFIKGYQANSILYKPIFDGLIQDVKDIKNLLGDKRA